MHPMKLIKLMSPSCVFAQEGLTSHFLCNRIFLGCIKRTEKSIGFGRSPLLRSIIRTFGKI